MKSEPLDQRLRLSYMLFKRHLSLGRVTAPFHPY
jgi:hypothetical protein